MEGTKVRDHMSLSVPHVHAVYVLTSGKRNRDPSEFQDLITLGRSSGFC